MYLSKGVTVSCCHCNPYTLFCQVRERKREIACAHVGFYACICGHQSTTLEVNATNFCDSLFPCRVPPVHKVLFTGRCGRGGVESGCVTFCSSVKGGFLSLSNVKRKYPAPNMDAAPRPSRMSSMSLIFARKRGACMFESCDDILMPCTSTALHILTPCRNVQNCFRMFIHQNAEIVRRSENGIRAYA